jgi:hypothetical protein
MCIDVRVLETAKLARGAISLIWKKGLLLFASKSSVRIFEILVNLEIAKIRGEITCIAFNN